MKKYKYKNNKSGKVAVAYNTMAAGMCHRTKGMTLVIYYYEDEDSNLGYPFVMEHREFYKEFTEI